jgi:hypothetical protein
VKEKKPVEASPAPLILPPPFPLREERILPSQVWTHLAKDQQHHLLQVVVLVCQELVPTWSSSLEGRIADE